MERKNFYTKIAKIAKRENPAFVCPVNIPIPDLLLRLREKADPPKASSLLRASVATLQMSAFGLARSRAGDGRTVPGGPRLADGF